MAIQDGLQGADKKILSILMIGQSNMAGRGCFGEVEPIVNENCYMLRMGRWQKMHEPINTDRPIFDGPFRSAISLAASFADELQKRLGRPIGLIPCADGGTCLAQWMPGEILFDHAVMQAKLALRTSEFGGIIWHQGESDRERNDEAAHLRDLVTMMTALRKELGAEEKPLVLGEISRDISDERWKIGDWAYRLNDKLAEAAEILPNCALARSDGLPLKDDLLHFNARACREFGKRYFAEFIRLWEKA